jgi:hypothetical protein
MLKTEERTIGAHTYRVTQLPAPVGRKLLVRLTKVIAPVLGTGVKGIDLKDPQKLSLLDIDLDSLGDALATFAEHLSEADLDYLCDVMAKQTQVNNIGELGPAQWLTLDSVQEHHFAGQYGDMFRWLAFSLEVNYRSFLSGNAGLSSLAAHLKAPMRSGSPSQHTSTGKSGASSAVSDSA